MAQCVFASTINNRLSSIMIIVYLDGIYSGLFSLKAVRCLAVTLNLSFSCSTIILCSRRYSWTGFRLKITLYMVVYRFAFITDFLGSYATQWSTTRFYCGLCLSSEKKKSLRQPIVLILKTVHLQQLKVMQSSKLGMWKGYHLSIKGIHGIHDFSVKNGMLCKSRGKGGSTSKRSLPVKTFLSTPRRTTVGRLWLSILVSWKPSD